jgi:glycosyltransferase involved in cell wall biosynthesis
VGGSNRGRATALVFHSAAMSGSARSFRRRLLATTADGARLVLVPGAGPIASFYGDIATVTVTRHGVLAVPSGVRDAVRAGWGLVADTVRFARVFRSHDVGVVISSSTYTPAAYFASRALGLTTVVYCGEILTQSGDRGRLAKRLVASALAYVIPRVADLTICCSRLVEAQFSHDARARVVTIYPSIDVSPLRNGPASEDGGARLGTGRPVIAAVGSLTEGRGQEDAIAALEIVRQHRPDATLALAGLPGIGPNDAEFERRLRAAVERAGLGEAVHFLGHVENARALMRVADVVINPARFDEPFGRVPYEALSVGTPVVVTTTGASLELLEPERHVLAVSPAAPEQLAGAILKLVSDDRAATQMVTHAQPILPRVSAEAGDEAYRACMEALLAER